MGQQNHSTSYYQIENPNVPMKMAIPGGIFAGRQIIVTGVFSGTLDKDHNDFTVDLRSNEDKSAFNFSVRFRERMVVRNSEVDGKWGCEERHGGYPFENQPTDQSFEFVLNVEHHKYHIRINDHSYDFYHRVPLNQINKLAIYGDMKIYKIAFSGVSSANWSPIEPIRLSHESNEHKQITSMDQLYKQLDLSAKHSKHNQLAKKMCLLESLVDVNKIEQFVHSILDVDNVVTFWQLAVSYEISSLDEACVDFISANSTQIMSSDHKAREALLTLSADLLASLLQREALYASESDVFYLVKEWHEKNQLRDKPVAQLVRCVLLPLMDNQLLVNEVKASGLFDHNEIFKAIDLKFKLADQKQRGRRWTNKNIAIEALGAVVLTGLNSHNLLNGDVVNFDSHTGYTSHKMSDNNSIVIKLGRPTLVNNIKMLLWNKDERSYSYFIDVSIDQSEWNKVVDNSAVLCKSWQTLFFAPRVVRYVRITGTNNTDPGNKSFHVVSFEIMFSTDKP